MPLAVIIYCCWRRVGQAGLPMMRPSGSSLGGSTCGYPSADCRAGVNGQVVVKSSGRTWEVRTRAARRRLIVCVLSMSQRRSRRRRPMRIAHGSDVCVPGFYCITLTQTQLARITRERSNMPTPDSPRRSPVSLAIRIDRR